MKNDDICEIKDNAFKNLENITEIYIASSVTKIAKITFDGIDNLTIYAEKFASENKINYESYKNLTIYVLTNFSPKTFATENFDAIND